MANNDEALENLRWKKFPVLNDGFVCLVDAMGSDDAIVQAARVSYGAGTKSVSDDRTLIRYLMRHRHTTPFEMAEIKLLVRVPMDAWRQWIRHRSASVNEYSTRYSVAIDSAQTTESDAWRFQATSNRQGSAGFFTSEEGAKLTESERAFQASARALYEERVRLGVAREQARKDLPLSTYTQAYWKCDLHNLFHFLALRMEEHAQLEIRHSPFRIKRLSIIDSARRRFQSSNRKRSDVSPQKVKFPRRATTSWNVATRRGNRSSVAANATKHSKNS